MPCSYLVLFGPLVLFPQVVSAQGGSALAAGLLLTSLPAGFGVAAVLGDRLLPAHWPNSRRCAVGGALASGCAAALTVPAPHPVSVVLLGLLGAGRCHTPANNAEIMTALPAGDAAAAGGMVNMTRGIGTALGVAVVTLGLHAGALLGHAGVRTGQGTQGGAGQEVAMAALAAVALAAAWAGMTASGSRSRPGSLAGAGPLIPQASPRRRPLAWREGIARLRRALRRGARAADPGNTLAVAQLELLAALAEHPGARPGQLARALNMRPNTVTTIVNALSARGMMRRSLPKTTTARSS